MLRSLPSLALAALALLASSPAPAQAAPRKAAPRKPAEVTRLEPGADTLGLLIWGGGRRPGDGEAAMASWNASELQSSHEAVALESTGVQGLKPGFHLVVLGACPQDRAQAVFEVVHAQHADAYLRWIPREAAEGLACPEIALPPDPCEASGDRAKATPAPDGAADADAEKDDGWVDRSDEDMQRSARKLTREIARGACTLTVNLDEHSESDGEFETVSNWSVVAELRKGTEVVETVKLGQPEWGTVDAFKVVGEGIQLNARELDSHCSGSIEFYEGADVRRVLRIGRGKIAVEEERDGLFGVCPPAGEGAEGSCEFRCASERYAAMDEVCKKPEDRARCEKSVPKWLAQEGRCRARCMATEHKDW